MYHPFAPCGDQVVHAGWGQGSAIEIVMAMELGMGGEFRIDSRAAHQIEREFGLWE